MKLFPLFKQKSNEIFKINPLMGNREFYSIKSKESGMLERCEIGNHLLHLWTPQMYPCIFFQRNYQSFLVHSKKYSDRRTFKRKIFISISLYFELTQPKELAVV